MMFVSLFMFLNTASSANPSTDNAIAKRTEAIASMKAFHPQDVMAYFTNNPSEAGIQPNEAGHEQTLSHLSQQRINEDKTARFIADSQASRPKITPNPKSAEIVYAEALLDNQDAIIHQGCYQERGACTDETTKERCEVSSHYEPFRCDSPLKVTLHPIHHPMIKRFVQQEIDLTSCGALKDVFCSKKQEITLNPRCEHLAIVVSAKGSVLPLLKTPTCKNPTFIVDFQKNPSVIRVDVDVIEYFSEEDVVSRANCEARIHDEALGFCVPDGLDACLFPQETKLIDGVPITRTCWGASQLYQCTQGVTSSCESLLNQGCSNIESVCKVMTGTHCDVEEKTFQCVKRTCLPDKEVCPDMPYCADGACDNTEPQESDDIAEGVSRLGAVSGTADEVSKYQIQTNEPLIFKGTVKTCDTYTANLHNCCTHEGLLDDLINCSEESKALERAREEGRVVSLNYYDKDLLSRRYVFCVFPTKLAGIIQIQGRSTQLGISFGRAKEPNCRGLTPSELEHINFKALDLTPITKPLLDKKNIPNDSSTDKANAMHIESLHEKGVSYD